VDRAKLREEEWRRNGAYHEAAHAVVDVEVGHTVRYVSIGTPGTNYEDVCRTAVNHITREGVDPIPVPWEALGHAISTMAGNMAMWRVAGEPSYPWDSWQDITSKCEDIEELIEEHDEEDIDYLGLRDCDTRAIREFCEAAARWGQRVRVPAVDDLPEGALPVPQTPSTGEEAFKAALRETEHLVDQYWWAITAVAKRLMEVGYLTGEEVEEIVFGSDPSEEEGT
jgi:hypothetical protein